MGLFPNLPDALISFLLFLTLAFASISRATRIEILNNCTYVVWAAANPGGGKQLKQGQTWTLDVIGSGRIWGRTNCAFSSDGRGKCESGDCDGRFDCQANGRAPNTVAQYSLDQSNNNDIFYVSVVEGFNIPMEFSPAGSSSNCGQVSKCAADVNGPCPMELRDPGGCNNPCTMFGNDQFCCTSGNICQPTSYSQYFSNLCRNAFTYPSDIGQRSSCPTGTDYKVVFCPSSVENINKTGANAVKVTIRNNCQTTIWPATLSTNNKDQLSTTGFELGHGQSLSFDLPSPWNGRFWARTRCSADASDKFTCSTGDCGSGTVECNGKSGAPPATLVEIFNEENGGQDFYDVSNADGFNVPASVIPQGGTGECKESTCLLNINTDCPAELQVKDGSEVVGCSSACTMFKTDQYCCTNAYSTPETCRPTEYSRFFEEKCPQAYSYVFDDQNSTFTCSSRPDYLITFCA